MISALLPALLAAACTAAPPACAPSGRWVAPATLRPIPDPVPQAFADPIILLGEQHDRPQDHAWQLATIERLLAANPSIVLGFEMFPRADQPVLDRWVSGQLSEPAFLAQSDWDHVWGFDPALYMPIFRLARDRHIPMLALNVSARTIRLVGQLGSAGVPPIEREGVGLPAPPTPSYRAALGEAMAGHGGMQMTPARVAHFIDAQLTWDRAMAEAIAAQRSREPRRTIVAIMGTGHLAHRDGVPHQLDALGFARALVLLPANEICAPAGRGFADGLYVE